MFRVPGPQRRGSEAEVRFQVSQETELLTSGFKSVFLVDGDFWCKYVYPNICNTNIICFYFISDDGLKLRQLTFSQLLSFF